MFSNSKLYSISRDQFHKQIEGKQQIGTHCEFSLNFVIDTIIASLSSINESFLKRWQLLFATEQLVSKNGC